MLHGFHETQQHRHVFDATRTTSVNSYGFSPLLLQDYLAIIIRIYLDEKMRRIKPFIVSVGGSTDELALCIQQIQDKRSTLKHRDMRHEIAVELNLSCPNIPHHPPPCYDMASLAAILRNVVVPACTQDPTLVIGLKVTPFTYQAQVDGFLNVLRQYCIHGKSPIAYLAATNTLGNCILEDDTGKSEALHGGMAGASLHPLSLGTVHLLNRGLRVAELNHIKIIGIGGVSDHAGFLRMRRVGADAVALATALGVHGPEIFDRI
jgi:dihydroorotate dehydrogenase (fumarate)